MCFCADTNIGCTLEQAKAVVELRPFDNLADLNTKLGQGKKKAGPSGISPRMFEDSKAIFKGYGTVDKVVSDCEEIGIQLRQEVAKWTPGIDVKGKAREGSASPPGTPGDEGALNFTSRAALSSDLPDYYISEQPTSLSSDVQLKEYQMLGINWMNLLYKKGYNCILADEMGLFYLPLRISLVI